MASRHYVLTPTVRRHLRQLKADSIRDHGETRTREYLKNLDSELNYAALHPERLPTNSETRQNMTGGSNLTLHHIGHHYAAFRVIGEGKIAVAALLGDTMDIPTRLKEANLMNSREIGELLAGEERKSVQEVRRQAHDDKGGMKSDPAKEPDSDIDT